MCPTQANEQRTSFDAFLRKLAKSKSLPILVPCFDATEALWKLDCHGPSKQPPPIALFHSAPPPNSDDDDDDDDDDETAD